jgi:tRNA (guanine6-N2)-methyltransferase
MPRRLTKASGARPTTDFATNDVTTLEALVPGGLEEVTVREFVRRLPRPASIIRINHGSVLLQYPGDFQELLQLRTVTSLYMVLPFAVPRPRALLGDETFTRIIESIQKVLKLHQSGSFRSLHLSAAGARSQVMQRLTAAIAAATQLEATDGQADLHLRVRPGSANAGWEILIRLSPRPLSSRPWRVCDMPGALNAAVAAGMVLLTDPGDDDVFVNPACGSGTLLIERAALHPYRRIVGCDTSPTALACARANIETCDVSVPLETHNWDAQVLPLDRHSADALCVDLPFGHRVGQHATNPALYSGILRECARIAKTGMLCCVLTHQADLMDELLRAASIWILERRTKVHVGGLIPTLYVLRKAS